MTGQNSSVPLSQKSFSDRLCSESHCGLWVYVWHCVYESMGDTVAITPGNNKCHPGNSWVTLAVNSVRSLLLLGTLVIKSDTTCGQEWHLWSIQGDTCGQVRVTLVVKGVTAKWVKLVIITTPTTTATCHCLPLPLLQSLLPALQPPLVLPMILIVHPLSYVDTLQSEASALTCVHLFIIVFDSSFVGVKVDLLWHVVYVWPRRQGEQTH